MPRNDVKAWVLLGCLLAGISSLPAQYSEADYDHAISTLRCDCGCHPQSLKDCACGYAAGKRGEIQQRMMEEDLDGETLVASWVDEFGEQILISPSKSGFNLIAWLGPLVGLALALAMMAWLLFRWRARPGQEDSPAPAAAPAADDPYMARLQRELQELE